MFSTIHVALMLLIMTMNGWVVIAILIGSTVGYWLNATKGRKDVVKEGCGESSAPVNCCAN